jgi:hypothetical protein
MRGPLGVLVHFLPPNFWAFVTLKLTKSADIDLCPYFGEVLVHKK